MVLLKEDRKPVVLRGMDLFTHLLVIGPTRCGKTATILKPVIMQILEAKKRGFECGLSVIEPKGDVAQLVADVSKEMGFSHIHIDPLKPDTDRFNPMEGDINDVAEATVVVLKGLFGKQEAFFATVQELSSRNVTKLLKELYGNSFDITDVLATLQDIKLLEHKVQELKKMKGESSLTNFFENELLGTQAEKYKQFVIGLRAQIENLISNDALKRIMTGKSSINIDDHFSKGGILSINTALGKLRTSGDAFGQFAMMHLQNGAFRRPGTEQTRIPHFLLVDEISRYINPDIEIFLSIAAEFKVAGMFFGQSLGQLAVESGKYSAKEIKRSILTNCRSKICFGGVSSEDAKEFAEIFGKDKITMRQSTYKNKILMPNLFPDSYRDTETEENRFDPTDLMDGLPRFHYVHQLMMDGSTQKPGIAKGEFIPKDWKERRAWEVKEKHLILKKFKTSFENIRKYIKARRIIQLDTAKHEVTRHDVPPSRVEENKDETIIQNNTDNTDFERPVLDSDLMKSNLQGNSCTNEAEKICVNNYNSRENKDKTTFKCDNDTKENTYHEHSQQQASSSENPHEEREERALTTTEIKERKSLANDDFW